MWKNNETTLLFLTSTVLLFLLHPRGINGDWCAGAETSTENPIGTCACAGHLWIDSGCHQGYWCEDTTGKGCVLVRDDFWKCISIPDWYSLLFQSCPSGEVVQADFAHDSWTCVPEESQSSNEILIKDAGDEKVIVRCPISSYNICPSDNVATTVAPPDQITGNPMGTCRCDGEIWLAEGCAYAFHCDAQKPNGGDYLACNEVRHILQYFH